MPLNKFTIGEARFERSPGQNAQIYTSDMIGSREGAPVTIGFGRYAPDQELNEIMMVDDVMVVIEGRLRHWHKWIIHRRAGRSDPYAKRRTGQQSLPPTGRDYSIRHLSALERRKIGFAVAT
jgi:hypothetical protein